MGERYLLGIDVGTSSLKVAVVCELSLIHI